jgi:hypothetical protein
VSNRAPSIDSHIAASDRKNDKQQYPKAEMKISHKLAHGVVHHYDFEIGI